MQNTLRSFDLSIRVASESAPIARLARANLGVTELFALPRPPALSCKLRPHDVHYPSELLTDDEAIMLLAEFVSRQERTARMRHCA